MNDKTGLGSALWAGIAATCTAAAASAAPITYTDRTQFDLALVVLSGVDAQVIDFESCTGHNGGTPDDVIASSPRGH